MSQALWFALAWIAGTAAILGGLMTLGSLLLWVVPSAHARSRKPDVSASSAITWQKRLKLLAFSAVLACVGLGILVVIPFPYF